MRRLGQSRKCVVVSGYYGNANAGDEAVLDGVTSALKEAVPGIRIIALTSNPSFTGRMHPDVEPVGRYNLWGVIKSILQCDIFISGGGSLLQDASSARSSFYYLGMLKLARLFNRKRVIYAQGIGPLSRDKVRQAVKNELIKADYISVRDSESRDLLKQIGLGDKNVELVGDPAFLVDADLEGADELLEQMGFAGKPFLCLSLRSWNGIQGAVKTIKKSVGQFCADTGMKAVALSMQDSEDLEIAKALDLEQTVACGGDYRLLKGIVARSAIVLSMRLHTLIFAASESVPFVALVYDPKVSSFSKIAGNGEGILVESVETERLIGELHNIYSNADAIRGELAEKAGAMAESARVPARRVKEMLTGKR